MLRKFFENICQISRARYEMTNCHKMLALYDKTVSIANKPSVHTFVHIDLPQNTYINTIIQRIPLIDRL